MNRSIKNKILENFEVFNKSELMYNNLAREANVVKNTSKVTFFKYSCANLVILIFCVLFAIVITYEVTVLKFYSSNQDIILTSEEQEYMQENLYNYIFDPIYTIVLDENNSLFLFRGEKLNSEMGIEFVYFYKVDFKGVKKSLTITVGDKVIEVTEENDFDILCTFSDSEPEVIDMIIEIRGKVKHYKFEK